jgi:hypothetical protein
VTTALIGAAATLVVALAGFAANYFLKWRDERRQVGAAERLLRAELTRAREVLKTGKPSRPAASSDLGRWLQSVMDDVKRGDVDNAMASLTDAQSGLGDDRSSAVPIWRQQWERFGARFAPPLLLLAARHTPL